MTLLAAPETRIPTHMYASIEPSNPRETIVVTGGGGGPSSIIREVREAVPDSEVVIGVAVGDSGGSNEAYRAKGLLPVRDIARVAGMLAAGPDGAWQLVNKRFNHDRIAHGTSIRGLRKDVDEFEEVLRIAQPGISPELVTEAKGHIYHAAGLLVANRTKFNARKKPEERLGALDKHTIGGLMMAGYTNQLGIVGAIERTQRILGIDDGVSIYPVTETSHHLLQYDNGTVYHGEHTIDEREMQHPESSRILLAPYSHIYGPLAAAIRRSSWVIDSAGSLTTSIMAVEAVGGMQEAKWQAERNGAITVRIANGERGKYDPKHWGAGDQVLYTYKQTGRLPNVLLSDDGSCPMEDEKRRLPQNVEVVPDKVLKYAGPIIGPAPKKNPLDTLERAGVAHSGRKIFELLRDNAEEIRTHLGRPLPVHGR